MVLLDLKEIQVRQVRTRPFLDREAPKVTTVGWVRKDSQGTKVIVDFKDTRETKVPLVELVRKEILDLKEIVDFKAIRERKVLLVELVPKEATGAKVIVDRKGILVLLEIKGTRVSRESKG